MRRWALVPLVWACLVAAAAADVVPEDYEPPPCECPPGTQHGRGHGCGCVVGRECESDDDCGGQATCREVHLCTNGRVVYDACEPGGTCEPGTCAAHRLCVAPPPPDPAPERTPPSTGAQRTEPSPPGCGCELVGAARRSGPGAAARGLGAGLVLVLAAVRRRAAPRGS